MRNWVIVDGRWRYVGGLSEATRERRDWPTEDEVNDHARTWTPACLCRCRFCRYEELKEARDEEP